MTSWVHLFVPKSSASRDVHCGWGGRLAGLSHLVSHIAAAAQQLTQGRLVGRADADLDAAGVRRLQHHAQDLEDPAPHRALPYSVLACGPHMLLLRLLQAKLSCASLPVPSSTASHAMLVQM